MAKKEHLRILKQGPDVWDKWKESNPEVKPDLTEANLSGANLGEADLGGADLSGADLSEADLREANFNWADLSLANLSKADLGEACLSRADLRGANLSKANLNKADFSEADLCRADLGGANLSRADFRGADLTEANLSGADLSEANLSGADLRGANLSGAALRGTHLSEANLSRADLSGAYLEFANLMNASLVETNLEEAVLLDCRVYGISTWGLKLKKAQQSNLIITPHGEPAIAVDNLEVAQFIYLLLYNEKTRNVIEPIAKKAVLILGRFEPQRKAVLKAIKEELHRRDYVPVVFDFEASASRDLTEIISILAHLSRFIIADITDPPGIPQELREIVLTQSSIPVQPLLQEDTPEDAMFGYFKSCPWVLKIHRYLDLDDLLPSLGEKVIEPAETKAKELQKRGEP
jgi:uncharacterized protein YjbI with pentapeptide repeats